MEIYLDSSRMEISHLTQNQYKFSTWSGGRTTELLLFPPDGEYVVGSFDYRVSSATIECMQSDFTILPGYKRLLMPLSGEVTLFQRENTVHLSPFDVYSFDGSVATASNGKCVDFNLIYKKGLNGTIQAIHTDCFQLLDECCFLYCIEACTVKISERIYSLKRQDSLKITGQSGPIELEIFPKEKKVRLIYACFH